MSPRTNKLLILLQGQLPTKEKEKKTGSKRTENVDYACMCDGQTRMLPDL